MDGAQVTAAGALGAMITPVVLVSASGLLVVSTSNRLARVVDRVRTLAAESEVLRSDASDGAKERKALNLNQIEKLAKRLLLLRGCMFCLYLAIGLLILSSVVIGIMALARIELNSLPVITSLLGAGSMLYASVLLVREANMAVVSTLEEVDFIRARAG